MANFEYPPVSFHFRVTFLGPTNGEAETYFQSVSGLEVSMETETYREGGENRFVYTLPVRAKYSPLVLKRGLLTDSALIKWAMSAINDQQIIPINIIVSLLNEEHEPLQTWNIVNAYPVKWSVDTFNAMESKLALETFELYYQYFKVI